MASIWDISKDFAIGNETEIQPWTVQWKMRKQQPTFCFRHCPPKMHPVTKFNGPTNHSIKDMIHTRFEYV